MSLPICALVLYSGPGGSSLGIRNDGIHVTSEEAGILQGFPADYDFKGGKTKRFAQISNAVPPLLQQRITETLI